MCGNVKMLQRSFLIVILISNYTFSQHFITPKKNMKNTMGGLRKNLQGCATTTDDGDKNKK